MERKREKYKVRSRLGRNASRCMWVRTEKNSRKWEVKKTGRLVRKSRPVKRLTRRNARKNVIAMGGGSTPRRGKLGKWRKKSRVGWLGLGRRYGAGSGGKAKLGRLMMQRSLGAESVKRLASVREGGKGGSPKDYVRSNPSTSSIGSVRWSRERRAEMRRWRSGRVSSLGEARERIEKKNVALVAAGLVEEVTFGTRKPGDVVKPGEGRKVSESAWVGVKYGRRMGGTRRMGKLCGLEEDSNNLVGVVGTQEPRLGRSRVMTMLDGRSVPAYAVVDGRMGVVRVKRRPRSGEVRRPARIDRSGRA